jgi:phage host-nuclease inhibitor protein Gam
MASDTDSVSALTRQLDDLIREARRLRTDLEDQSRARRKGELIERRTRPRVPRPKTDR